MTACFLELGNIAKFSQPTYEYNQIYFTTAHIIIALIRKIMCQI